ncbi:MAG: hypothetical protein ACRDP9_28310 [Kribbellaceae bacterium]
MSRVRSVLRWVFVRGPAAFYELAESSPGLISVLTLAALAGAGGLGAGIGALIALSTTRPVSPAVDIGVVTGILVLVGLAVMSLVVVGVLWVRGVSPAEAYAGRATGRHAAGSVAGWRRRGDALVPGSLIGFFAIVAVIFAALGVHAWQVSRPWPEPTAVVDGVAASYHEPGLLDRGAGTVVVRYTVGGAPYTLELAADTDDRVIKHGDTVRWSTQSTDRHTRGLCGRSRPGAPTRRSGPAWPACARRWASPVAAATSSGAAGAAPDDSARRDRTPDLLPEQRPQRNSARHRNPTRGLSHWVLYSPMPPPSGANWTPHGRVRCSAPCEDAASGNGTSVSGMAFIEWPRDRKGRALARAYLPTFAAMVIGVLWVVLNQITGGGGSQAGLGIAVFLASQAALFTIAFGLRDNVRGAPAANGYPLAWHRLSLGLELLAAMKLLRQPQTRR